MQKIGLSVCGSKSFDIVKEVRLEKVGECMTKTMQLKHFLQIINVIIAHFCGREDMAIEKFAIEAGTCIYIKSTEHGNCGQDKDR